MKKLILFTFIGIISFLSFAAYFYYRVTHMYVYQELASNTSVSAEWTVIKPESPMKQNRRFQAVSIVIDGLKTSAKNQHLFLPNGTTLNPEVNIFDEFGNEYSLESRGMLVNNYNSESNTFDVSEVNLQIADRDLPKGRSYVEVRIRSDQPFVAKRISWCNYDLK